MDAIKRLLPGQSSLCHFAIAISLTALVILEVALMVYLGIFAFANPDPNAWYGRLGDDPTSTGALFINKEAGIVQGAAEMINIHRHFENWFLWGFLLIVGPFVVGTLSLIAYLISKEAGMIFANVGLCLFGAVSLAWWILGIVWRFS